MLQQQGVYPAALTIAGSDSSGGAGIQADLKTFSALGVYGTSAITAITAQNTTGVCGIEVLSSGIVQSQIEAVMDDIDIRAVKTGMLPDVATIEIVAKMTDKYHIQALIVDPVMVATTGAKLVTEETVGAIRKHLLTRAALITPNTREASILTGIEVVTIDDFAKVADLLIAQGCNAVLIKGGHLQSEEAVDILFQRNKEPERFASSYIDTNNTHGTGCTLSAAIAAYVALGETLGNAVRLAKKYITEAIQTGAEVQTGKGNGPVNHFFQPQVLKILSS